MLEIDKLFPEANAPVKNGASYDLIACTHGIIEPGHRAVVPLGFILKVPDGLYARITARTGLFIKQGLIVIADMIDPDYTGELKVVLYNSDLYKPFVFHPGYNIAQLVLERYETPDVVEVKTYYKVTGI
jgi:dUTP pyrophosphatase